MANVEQIKRAKSEMLVHLSETKKLKKIEELLQKVIDDYNTITGMAIYDSTGDLQLRDMKLVGVPAPVQEEYYRQAGWLLKLVFQDIGKMAPDNGGYRGPVAEDLGSVTYIQVELSSNRRFGIMPLDGPGSFVLVGICSDAGRYVQTQFQGVIEKVCADVKRALA